VFLLGFLRSKRDEKLRVRQKWICWEGDVSLAEDKLNSLLFYSRTIGGKQLPRVPATSNPESLLRESREILSSGNVLYKGGIPALWDPRTPSQFLPVVLIYRFKLFCTFQCSPKAAGWESPILSAWSFEKQIGKTIWSEGGSIRKPRAGTALSPLHHEKTNTSFVALSHNSLLYYAKPAYYDVAVHYISPPVASKCARIDGVRTILLWSRIFGQNVHNMSQSRAASDEK